jgi:hypothetical protein
MTPTIPPADEAEFEAWASDGDPNSEPLMTKDGMMSIERAARNGFFAGLAVGRRTTHPPAQQAAGLAEARERLAHGVEDSGVAMRVSSRDMGIVLAELDRLTRAPD